MIFGVLKEIKPGENRVICTPMEIASIIASGHTVLVQKQCGIASGFPDVEYEKAGAVLVDNAEEIYGRCDMVAKVKEFEESEFGLIRENQIILGCIHPAGNKEEVDAILKSKCIAFAAEDSHRYGSPNCEAAGKQGALFGLESMLSINGGKGKYVGGLAGAPRMNVLILGGGIVGQNSLSVLYALGANITVMDIDYNVLKFLKNSYNQRIDTMFCTKEAIASILSKTDMVINAVKWPKHRTDFLIDKEMLNLMEPGSVLVDISNDNPGAIESSRETHHDNPRYVVNGVLHYCVSNIPGAIANSISVAYAAEMLPAIMSILNDGVTEACIKNGFVRRSLTAYKGFLTHEETSAIQDRPWIHPEEILDIKNRKLDFAPPATTSKSDNLYKNNY